MSEQLTAEEFEALEQLEDAPVWMGVDGGGVFGDLCDGGYIGDAANKWYIRDTGRKALATYKAQRDLVLFIAEFEEWLEGKYEKSCSIMAAQGLEVDEVDEIEFGVWATVISKYRECKQRIEQPHDAQ